MTKDYLIKLIEEKIAILDEEDSEEKIEINIKSKQLTFPITITCIADTMVVIFGGYGTHFEAYGLDVYEVDEIVYKFEEYILGYPDEVAGSLKDCTLYEKSA